MSRRATAEHKRDIGLAIAPRPTARTRTNCSRMRGLGDVSCQGGWTRLVLFFEAEMDARIQARGARSNSSCRNALAAGRLQLYCRPLVNAKNGEVTMFQALLRWFHPRLGATSRPANSSHSPKSRASSGRSVSGSCAPPVPRRRNGRRVFASPSTCRRSSSEPESGQSILGARCVRSSGSPLGGDHQRSVLEADARTLAVLHELHSPASVSSWMTWHRFSSATSCRSFPFDKIKIDQTFVRDMSKAHDSIAIIKCIKNRSGTRASY